MAHVISNILSFVTGGGFRGPRPAAPDAYHGFETPAYVVEDRVKDAEIRRYAPYLVATVTVSGRREDALRAGFRMLAGYIFGGNTSRTKVAMTAPVGQSAAPQSEKIAMTVPVSQQPDGDKWAVTFTLPATYTRETLPVPTTDEIRFDAIPAERLIVLRFSGRATTELLDQKETELRAIAETATLTLDGPVRYAFYDDPATLPFRRRNEVAFVLGPAATTQR